MGYSGKFATPTNEDNIHKFYDRYRQFLVAPRLVVKYHAEIRNVEWLAGEDLTLGLESPWPSSPQPEVRALQILYGLSAVFGFSGDEALDFRRRLALKHTLRSRMGTHCIFELRDRNQELLENCFVVHLDNDMHAVFLASIYQVGRLRPVDQESTSRPEGRDLQALVQKALPKERLVSLVDQGWAYAPDWEAGDYGRRLVVKAITDKGNHTVLVDETGAAATNSVSKHARPTLGAGQIYKGFWKEQQPDALPSERVALRDLVDTRGSLTGRYVKVTDSIDAVWKEDVHELTIDPGNDSSHFDRVMAYYHTDLAQRYFRELGLDMLDSYPHLNPLNVNLTAISSRRTTFAPLEAVLYLSKIPNSKGFSWTDARDPRIVYHEYVHAVTDALARLGRPNLADRANDRFIQMIQACAMDEGLADYFACSLAARFGAQEPQFGTLRLTAGRLTWRVERDLAGTTAVPSASEAALNSATAAIALEWQNAQSANASNPPLEEMIYRWSLPWSRYLWRLRSPELLGVEIADMVIANSILFLTRWSDFAMGVWALVTADQLLFRGIHRDRILSGVGAGMPDSSTNRPLEFSFNAFADDQGMATPPVPGTDRPTANPDLELGDLWVEQQGRITKVRNY